MLLATIAVAVILNVATIAYIVHALRELERRTLSSY